ncbi:MAG: undecaprenyl-diphosphate phosphatase [Planctomycetota bacterium]|nr:undecaprenyl-diphosphate phosphatase [Planctomycetota bacterium]
MELWQLLVLAILQGITEFLPVSSSGHLVVLASVLLDESDPALNLTAINVVLHLGTLLTILVFYRQRILTLLKSERRTLALVATGTLPAVLVGLPLKIFLEEALTEPLLAGTLLIGTGTLLISTSKIREGNQSIDSLTYRNAILIGIGQSLAILPGLSRSGTTISVALFVGVKRQAAAEFSFLLAIPAIAGAGLLEAKDLLQASSTSAPLVYLALGAALAFTVGTIALRWLLRWLQTGRLAWFAWWCIPLGTCVVAYHLLLAAN